jgi:hypothetical protein
MHAHMYTVCTYSSTHSCTHTYTHILCLSLIHTLTHTPVDAVVVITQVHLIAQNQSPNQTQNEPDVAAGQIFAANVDQLCSSSSACICLYIVKHRNRPPQPTLRTSMPSALMNSSAIVKFSIFCMFTRGCLLKRRGKGLLLMICIDTYKERDKRK